MRGSIVINIIGGSYRSKVRNQLRVIWALFSIIFISLQLSACATKLGTGYQHIEDHEYPEALVLFEEVANQGIRRAAITTSNLYIIDYQIPRDLDKSKYYLEMALNSEYQRYDQASDYFIPLIKAYQLLADKEVSDKSLAFEILNYEKYQEYYWPLSVIAHCNLVGYGTQRNIPLAKQYFEKAVDNQIFDGSNVFYAWWLAVYPDESFRDPERALTFVLEVIDDEDYMDKPLYLDTLAVVYAINGQFDKAENTQQKAIDILDSYIEKYSYMTAYKASFDSRLEHYKLKKPWIFSSNDIERCGYDTKRCLKQ